MAILNSLELEAGGFDNVLSQFGVNRHSKLLASAFAAENNNPCVLRPWLAPQTYTANTAYALGNVINYNGSWFLCGIAGVSPASGGEPTNIANAQFVRPVASGPYWTYIGGALTPDPGDGAPTVSVVTTSPNLGASWGAVAFPSLYHVRGAYTTIHNTFFWKLHTFDAAAAAPVCRGASVSFRSDDNKVAIQLPSNGQQYRVIVDGRYLEPGSRVIAGNDSYLIIDWTATSGRKVRTYEVETNKSISYFGGTQTSISGSIFPSRLPSEVRVAWISDSYGEGSSYGPFLAGGSIPSLVGKRLGWRDVWNMSVGGTGYINQGAGPSYTFRQRVAEALSRNPDVFIFMGSTNDTASAASVQAEVLSTLQQVRAGSNAPIIVIGVPSLNLASAPAVETAIAAAVTQFSDSKTYFIPIIGDTLPWVLGSWNNAGAPSGSVRNDSFMIGGDNTHAPEYGLAYYAARIEQAVRDKVLPSLISF